MKKADDANINGVNQSKTEAKVSYEKQKKIFKKNIHTQTYSLERDNKRINKHSLMYCIMICATM